MTGQQEQSRVAPLILVIDDVEDTRDVFETCLSAHGYRVATAKDGFDGVRKAATLQPDLILMDINMPGMDGVETTRFLKRHGSTSGIPVVAVTGQSMLADDARARQKGFKAVLTKPVRPEALGVWIHDILR
jgi:CheY-like chemotaxis protein